MWLSLRQMLIRLFRHFDAMESYRIGNEWQLLPSPHGVRQLPGKRLIQLAYTAKIERVENEAVARQAKQKIEGYLKS